MYLQSLAPLLAITISADRPAYTGPPTTYANPPNKVTGLRLVWDQVSVRIAPRYDHVTSLMPNALVCPPMDWEGVHRSSDRACIDEQQEGSINGHDMARCTHVRKHKRTHVALHILAAGGAQAATQYISLPSNHSKLSITFSSAFPPVLCLLQFYNSHFFWLFHMSLVHALKITTASPQTPPNGQSLLYMAWASGTITLLASGKRLGGGIAQTF
jgi:hypothetical protein